MSQYGGQVCVVHKRDRSCQENRLSSVQYWGLNWGLQNERQFVFCSGWISLWKVKTVIQTTMGENIVLFNNHTETFYDTHFDWQTGVQVLHLQCTKNMRLGVVKCSKVTRIEKGTLSALAFFSRHWHDNIIKENYFAINEKEVNFYGWIETLWSNQWLGVQLRAPRECAVHCKQPSEGALSRRQIPGHTQTLFQN